MTAIPRKRKRAREEWGRTGFTALLLRDIAHLSKGREDEVSSWRGTRRGEVSDAESYTV
jgi:hypothetical protein